MGAALTRHEALIEATVTAHGGRLIKSQGEGDSTLSVFPRASDAVNAAVDAANLDRFALLGSSHGGPAAVAYSVRHPERVSHLVLYGTYARGRLRRGLREREEAEAMIAMVRAGWGRSAPAFRRAFTTMFVPGATPETTLWCRSPRVGCWHR